MVATLLLLCTYGSLAMAYNEEGRGKQVYLLSQD